MKRCMGDTHIRVCLSSKVPSSGHVNLIGNTTRVFSSSFLLWFTVAFMNQTPESWSRQTSEPILQPQVLLSLPTSVQPIHISLGIGCSPECPLSQTMPFTIRLELHMVVHFNLIWLSPKAENRIPGKTHRGPVQEPFSGPSLWTRRLCVLKNSTLCSDSEDWKLQEY